MVWEHSTMDFFRGYTQIMEGEKLLMWFAIYNPVALQL